MPTPEQYADMQFPLLGMDLSMAFGTQQQGTTRVGTNVRAYEPLTRRARGGSRNGLLKYINGQTGGPNLIQHLNYVVDPQAQAIPDYDPPGGVTGGPNDSLGPFGDGSYLDPTGAPRDTSGRLVRFGGTGSWFTRNRKNSKIRFVQGATGSAALGVALASYPANVTQGDLLVAMVHMYPSNVANTVALADNFSNVWAPASSPVTNTFSTHYHLSLWYAIAGASGACSVTATSSDLADPIVLGLAEYSGTKASGVLDNSSTNTVLAAIGAGGTYTATTGSVPVAGTRELVVGAFLLYDLSVGSVISPYILRPTVAPTGTLFGEFEDHIGVAAGEAATFSITVAGSVQFYLAAGASFKPRVP